MSKFLDEHPGGEEVILDVGGMDASDAFEDVGHSDEAREQLESLLIGTLKIDPEAAAAKKSTAKRATGTATAGGATNGTSFGLMLVVVALLAAAVYKFAI